MEFGSKQIPDLSLLSLFMKSKVVWLQPPWTRGDRSLPPQRTRSSIPRHIARGRHTQHARTPLAPRAGNGDTQGPSAARRGSVTASLPGSSRLARRLQRHSSPQPCSLRGSCCAGGGTQVQQDARCNKLQRSQQRRLARRRAAALQKTFYSRYDAVHGERHSRGLLPTPSIEGGWRHRVQRSSYSVLGGVRSHEG